MDELDELRAELRRAMAISERAEQTAAELGYVVETLLEILRARGQLGEGHLRMLTRLRQHARLITEPQIRLESAPDKYGMAGAEIDCASRMHLCHGRCCAYDISLSEQDLVEGKLAWRLEQPYVLPHGDHGSCAYQDRTDGGCQCYAHRPAQCRQYDCREDANIWVDFEAGIAAPLRPGLVPLRRKPTAP
ncbi:MAG: YkgJ family cysteine cluster protein [Myxococcales bacterium]|nr:YkgJ family cysteine cluster protein [Myxococcales bacterium]